ncbi:restriction endonuclease [Terracidiphilus gabretensis]|uniref:restriction endonuclease n=1 Tax=Terracidiphilus gabretensis TaxID=1577687 RepID=UPI0018D21B8E|nr:restriction endonuclease [Terracidiphilus gabretensis]
MTNKGSVLASSKDYELLVREIYQQMLDQDQAQNVIVQHNVQKQGRATSHQIDVYWEFCLGGVTHKVAIQAKRWKNPIRKGDVLTFKGVLEDLPGTIGIMITSSRYQKGAVDVAKASGIMICNLQENLGSPVCAYPGATLTFRMKGFLTAPDGSFLGALADVAQNIPTVSDLSLKADSSWHQANDPLPEPMTLVNLPQPVQFFDQDGKELITLTRILGGFYEEMHREGQMSARKTHRFEYPTFVKLVDPPFTIKEESLSATVVFTRKTTEIVFKAPNVAVFILKNLNSGAEHHVVTRIPTQ